MAINRTQVESLLQTLSRTDPRLYDTLRAMLLYIDTKDQQIVASGTPVVNAQGIPVLAPANFAYTLPGDQLHLTWDASIGASYYEIKEGLNPVLRTSTLEANLEPILSGVYTYWVRAVNGNGLFSPASSLTITINNPALTVITPTVIDNNVLLYWALPATYSFNIDHYQLYQDGVYLRDVYGTFTTASVLVSGDYAFDLLAIDLAGNVGASSPVTVTVTLPVDFEIRAVQLSTFTGTKTNCMVEDSVLYAPIIDETYEEHFIDNSWVSIQEQLDAGYPLYIQPGNVTATYVEDFDFSDTFDVGVVDISYTLSQFDTSLVTVTKLLQTSTDGITWSAGTTGASTFGTNVRYARLTLTFLGASDKAICSIQDLQCTLRVTYLTVTGQVSAYSSDVAGTIVYFSGAVWFDSPFRDVSSIQVSLVGTTAGYVVVDFVDIENPTHFHVFVYNLAGARISATVDWTVVGISV